LFGQRFLKGCEEHLVL